MKTLRHRRKRKGEFVSYVLFVGADLSAFLLAFISAYYLRFRFLKDYFPQEPPDFELYLNALPFMIAVFLLAFRQHQIYVFDILRRRLDEIALIFRAIIVSAVVIMAVTFLYRDVSYSRIVFILDCIFCFFYVCIFRHAAYALDGWLRSKMGTRIRVLIVGANRSSRQIIRRINRSYRNRYKVIGVLSSGQMAEEKHFEEVSVVGHMNDVIEKLSRYDIDEVILTVSDFSEDRLSELFLKCENEMITLLKIPDLFGIFTSGVSIHYIDDVPLIGLKKSPLDKMSNRFLKRSFDMIGSFLGLIVLSPALLLAAIMIKLQDGGPIFYKQNRIGMDGRSFFIYKFRTMTVNAEDKTGPVWATQNDQRTTKIGKLLRKFNIDELPQLWNVWRNDMSLVGPRPERPHFVGKFREDVPRYMARHKIKSGITGWAQVNGYRGDTSITERTRYDLYYYENWSLALDLKIILLTFFAFKNAY